MTFNMFKKTIIYTPPTCFRPKHVGHCVYKLISISLISGFRRDVDEKCTLLGYYAASCGNCQESEKNSDSWPLKMGPIRCPETSVNNYETTPRNIPEGLISNFNILVCIFVGTATVYLLPSFGSRAWFQHWPPKGRSSIYFASDVLIFHHVTPMPLRSFSVSSSHLKRGLPLF